VEDGAELVAATLGLHLGPTDCPPRHLCSACRTTLQAFAGFKAVVRANIEFIVSKRDVILLHGLEYAKKDKEGLLDENEELDSKDETSKSLQYEVGGEDNGESDGAENGDWENDNLDWEELVKVEGADKKSFKSKRLRKSGFCDICNRNYNDINGHRSQIHNRKEAKCSICCKVFRGKMLLKCHMTTHTSLLVPCPQCGKLVKENGMQKHIKYCHKEGADIKCTYPDCDKLFKQPQCLSNHIKRVHLRETSLCTNCGQSVFDLYKHKNVCCPENIALITCKFCQKVFASSTSKIIHEKAVHNSEGPTACTICGKMVRSMEQHMDNIHSNKAKRHPCLVEGCGKAFKTSTELNVHTDGVHLKSRSQCADCGQWFSVKHLKTHIKTAHSGAQRTEHPCPEVGAAD
jgi:hypothetical protein